MNQDPPRQHPGDGFTGDVTWEVEKNSKGVNVRIRGNIVWQNVTLSPFPPPDKCEDMRDFMVPLGSLTGDTFLALREVIRRLTAEARAGIESDLAALEGAS